MALFVYFKDASHRNDCMKKLEEAGTSIPAAGDLTTPLRKKGDKVPVLILPFDEDDSHARICEEHGGTCIVVG